MEWGAGCSTGIRASDTKAALQEIVAEGERGIAAKDPIAVPKLTSDTGHESSSASTGCFIGPIVLLGNVSNPPSDVTDLVS
jgi:hypothetical protein